MEARHEALPIVEGTQGIDASLEPDVQVQVCVLGHVLLQHRESEIVTCPHGQYLVPLITSIGEHTSEIGSQRLDVRLHSCARPALGPYESPRELRRPRLISLRPGDQ